MIVNPFAAGPGTDGLWISEADKARVDRFNSRLAPDDGRRLLYSTLEGRPLVPMQWSGNPWNAAVLLLLLNPAPSPHLDEVYRHPESLSRMEAAARGDWDEEYPNPLLHPDLRSRDPWTAKVVFGSLHRHLTLSGESSESAWKRLSQRCAVLELSPWTSYKWSTSAVLSTTVTSVQLVNAAVTDPDRVVLLARGESDWRCAGFLEADAVPKSAGVRSHQCRLSSSNFPSAWGGVLELMFR